MIFVIRSSALTSINVPCLAGAPLKVCPQGFSCCTVEMEEKLSQQSHTEIKAPVSRLSTNLQSTFRQRHDHFDSKHKHSAPANTLQHFQVPLAAHACVTCLVMDFPTCRCTARSGDTLSVCRPIHLSLTVSTRGLVILLRTAWSSATRFRPPLERHACL